MDLLYNYSEKLGDRIKNKRTLLFEVTILLCFSISLVASLFFKESWLWMDEVLSYTLLSDPSLAHMNWAIVSNIDANPPLFFNLYWLLGHGISLNPYFLRATSIVLFAGAVTLFYRYTTRLVGVPATNAAIFLIFCSLTYLNYTLSTQIRTYSLYLLIGGVYLILLHKLIRNPTQIYLLVAHVLIGLALAMVHNFGLFYLAVSFSFVGLLWLWSKQKAYLPVLASYGLIIGIWLLIWYPNFKIQSRVGEPHSWIPLPTFLSFFKTLGELLPTPSAHLEVVSVLVVLPMMRVMLVVGLFLYMAVPRLKQGFKAMIDDEAFSFYILAGYISAAVAVLTLLVSVGYKSIFLSRYQWPSMLLMLYLLTYTYNHFIPAAPRETSRMNWWLPLLAMGVVGFMFYQNQKLVLFPKEIVKYLPANPANDPVFLESADYFLPLQHHHITNAHFLLDRQTAISPQTIHNSTNDYNVINSLREKYGMKGTVPRNQFNKAHFSHFFVVDEASRYQIEDFVARGQVKIIRILPVPIEGHRILECSF